MSGHSHWATIKHKKGAADAKRGAAFSKVSKLLMAAARNGGADPKNNLKLAYAIEQARACNMPKDTIDKTIKKNTGKLPGTTNWVETIPVPVTAQLMARGRERFNISCSPCHGEAGDGKGITSRLGMTVIADLHDVAARKVPQQPDGAIFNTLSYGKGLMQGYAADVSIPDRWAIVAYVRALQRSRLASLDDVPAAERATLTKPLPPTAATVKEAK